MMGVDEAGDDHMAAGVIDLIDRRRRLSADCHQLDDAAVLDDQPAAGAFRQNRQGFLDPQTHDPSPSNFHCAPDE